MFTSPTRKRVRQFSVTALMDYEKTDIRNIIYNFHITENVSVTVKALTQKLKADHSFSVSKTSVRRIINDLGFKFRKTENNRRLLIEFTNIQEKRINYLMKIKQYQYTNGIYRRILYS